MASTFESHHHAHAESHSHPHPHQQPRQEPLLLKPTTLPHNPASPIDTGAAGERIDSKLKRSVTLIPTPSTLELVQSSSQTTQIEANGGNSSWSSIFLIALRISFYILVLTMTVGLTFAACKFTNIWDPCTTLYINTTECKVTSYFKGMVYHTDCTEKHHCILPGFESVIQHQGWSLHQPEENATQTIIIH